MGKNGDLDLLSRGKAIDLADEADVRRWAARFCLTPNELRETIEEAGAFRAGRNAELDALLARLGGTGS